MEEWLTGLEGVEAIEPGDEETRYTAFSQFYPGAALPQVLRAEREGSRIVISCLSTGSRYEWRLGERSGGEGTEIALTVELGEKEAPFLAQHRAGMGSALERLARLAERA